MVSFWCLLPFPDASSAVLIFGTLRFPARCRANGSVGKDHVARGDVSGLIGLTGEASGSISVSFTEKSILAIVSGMFGEEMKVLNNEIMDAVGEIANMISGQARQKLEALGKSLNAAIPAVIMGKNHSISHITSYPIIAIPFETDQGAFTVEFCFEE